MRRYSVSARGLATVEVRAANWLTALGEALRELGRDHTLERLACEVLPNGTVIAREIRTGLGFVVQEVPDADPPAEEPSSEVTVAHGDALREHLAGIARAPDRVRASQLALEACQLAVPAESGTVLLVEGDHLRFVAVVGPQAARLVGLRLPRGTGVVGFCMDKRRALVVDDAAEDARHSPDVDHLTGHQTRALACAPILYGDQTLGAIELVNLPDGVSFGREHLFDLQAVARALGDRLGQLTPAR